MADTNQVLNGRYRLDEEVGQGNMGVVYKAYDHYFNRIVAIKLMTTAGMGMNTCVRFLSEVLAIAKLDHPNIVKVLDAGEVDNIPYIVMEYIEGTSLHEQPPSNEKDVIKIGIGICDALGEAHSCGIIHCDLKPENIIQTTRGTVKLLILDLPNQP